MLSKGFTVIAVNDKKSVRIDSALLQSIHQLPKRSVSVAQHIQITVPLTPGRTSFLSRNFVGMMAGDGKVHGTETLVLVERFDPTENPADGVRQHGTSDPPERNQLSR